MKSTCGCPTRRRIWLLMAILVSLTLAWIFLRRQIERPLAVHFLLTSDAPREEAFFELAEGSGNPVDFLDRCWATGRIGHRELVAQFLKSCAATNPPWFPDAEALLLAGATDADMSVRELALATLANAHNPHLFACAHHQLQDPDPLVRHLGLDYLRKADPKKATPIVVSLLDDPDLRVATAAEVALMRWSGEDYGVREVLAVAPREGPNPGSIDQTNLALIRQGISRRKDWWQHHAAEYPTLALSPGGATPPEIARPALPDFVLNDLDGKRVRLSDFRGKVVLLNFWATWCTACLAEIPDLIALRRELGDKVVILGIALDGVTDEHGHDPGAEADGDSHALTPSANATRDKVARAVKSRGINYPVLLDAKNVVGAQYNGGELPTTVIIDAKGRLRRRFIGERNVAVLKEMIRQASASPGPSVSQLTTRQD